MTKHTFTDKEGHAIIVEAENMEKSIGILERLGINPENLKYSQYLSNV